MKKELVRVVIYYESGWLVAQCLEYDIRAQGKTFSDVVRYLLMTLDETRKDTIERHGEPFAKIEPAPKHFQAMWKKRAAIAEQVNPPQKPPMKTPQLEFALI